MLAICGVCTMHKFESELSSRNQCLLPYPLELPCSITQVCHAVQ